MTTETFWDVAKDICSNRHGGDENSVAANLVTDKQRDRARILTHLRTCVDATSDEIEQALDMPHQTASARLSGLKKDGLILPGSWKRKTRSGCKAQPWRINSERSE